LGLFLDIRYYPDDPTAYGGKKTGETKKFFGGQ
jgi:hypothetical protein